jgi:hypothetical protein
LRRPRDNDGTVRAERERISGKIVLSSNLPDEPRFQGIMR